jgi:hypothetical protein
VTVPIPERSKSPVTRFVVAALQRLLRLLFVTITPWLLVAALLPTTHG